MLFKVASKSLKRKEHNCSFENLSLRCGTTKKTCGLALFCATCPTPTITYGFLKKKIQFCLLKLWVGSDSGSEGLGCRSGSGKRMPTHSDMDPQHWSSVFPIVMKTEQNLDKNVTKNFGLNWFSRLKNGISRQLFLCCEAADIFFKI